MSTGIISRDVHFVGDGGFEDPLGCESSLFSKW